MLHGLLINWALPKREYSRPTNGWRVPWYTEGFETSKVLLVEIVVLPEDISGGAVSYPAGDAVGEKIPDGGPSATVFGGAIDLVGGGTEAPGKVLGECEGGDV